MRRFSTFFVALLLSSAGLLAQQQSPTDTFQVQGIPRPDLQQQIPADIKTTTSAASKKQLRATANVFTFDDILVWAGEGSSRAALAVQWNDPRETNAMVWGYQFDGAKYGVDILMAVAKVDPRFHPFMDATTSGYGSAIAGIGYDANGDGVFFVKNKVTGESIYPDENGILPHPVPTYDYDNYVVGDPEDYWQAGWYQGYWSYWLSTDGNDWSYSGLGASSRKLTDGSWDGWNYAVNMVNPSGFKPFIPAPAPGYVSGTFLLSSADQSSVLSVMDKKGTLIYDIYGTENPGLSLDANAYNVTSFGSSIYVVSDEHLLVADALKLTQQANLAVSGGRSFAGVNAAKGYIGTANGIYVVNLDATPSLGSLVAGTNAETGTMIYSNGYVFAIQKGKGVTVINASTNTVKTTIKGNYVLLNQSADGTIWAGAGTTLSRINPETFEALSLTLSDNAALTTNWSDWNAKQLVADAANNVLYWVNTGYTSNPNSVFQYIVGQPASIASPLFSLPNETGLIFSKAAISLNYQANQLTVSADKITGATIENRVYMVDYSTGDLLNTFTPALNGSMVNIAYPDKAAKINLPSSYTFALNVAPTVVSLNGQLTDADNVAYNIASTVSSDNTELVTANVANNQLTITPQPGQSGSAKLTFLATSNGVTSKRGIDVLVTRALQGIALPYQTKTLKQGAKDTLNVTFTPDNATDKTLTWSRISGTAVSISNGIVTASSVGTATIKAVSADGAFSDTCHYTVVSAPLSGISFNKDTSMVYVGQKDTLKVNFLPADAYNKGITWTQNPTGKMGLTWHLSDGLLIITGTNAGQVILSGKSSDGGFIDTCIVNVVFNPATSLELNADTVDLTAPQTFALKGTFLPEGSSNTKITWTSRNTAVATLNTSGTVTAVAAGETWIIAQSQDDTELVDSALVRVAFVPLTDFSIAQDTLLGVGEYFYAAATFMPTDASNKTITWSSSDATIATASASGTQGYIRGLKVGEAWIYAETNGTFKDSIKVIVDTIHVTGFALRDDMKEVWKKVSNMWFPYSTMTPNHATNTKILYSFEKEDVVNYYSTGSTYIKALKFGDSKVYFSTDDGGFKDTMLVHVVENVTSLMLDVHATSLTVGDVITLHPAALPEASIQTATWTSSNPDAVTVDANGVVAALKAGTASIIAASTDVTSIKDTCIITVNNQISEEITLSDTAKTVFIGDSWTLAPTVLPVNTTNKRLYWTSSDYAVLDVDANGVVRALNKGNAIITAYCKDGGAEKSCTVTVDTLDYTQGVFFVNEDWFGHQNSSLNFLTNSGIWVYNAYSRENQGKELGCTSQYGIIYGDRLYIMSKQAQDPGASIVGSRLAVVDAKTLKSLKEFENIAVDGDGQSVADGRAFLGVDEHKGYIGTSNGIYVYNSDAMEIGAQITGTGSASGDLYSEQTGTMLRVGERVFAVNQKKGIEVINAESDALETVIGAPKDGSNQRGFGSIVMSKDGNLWCSVASDISGSGNAQDYLLKLNPYTLDTTRVILPAGYGIPNSWYAWTADGFCSSKQENKIYWKNNGGWFSSTKIYSYDIDAAQASEVFDLANYDDGAWGIYGAGFRLDPVTNDIYASLFRTFGNNTYCTVKINPATKAVTTYPMEAHYWFPAMPVFPDNAAPVVSDMADTTVTAARSFGFLLKNLATDADNMDAAIVKTVFSLSNANVLTAKIKADSILISPKTNGECSIGIRFNSNGKTVDKMFTVTVDVATGISNVKEQSISVYPNPFTEYIIVEAKSDDRATIYDISGKQVLTVGVKAGSNRIETSALGRGVYVLKIGLNTVKIVK
jgi:uncharacterized protein YjdB